MKSCLQYSSTGTLLSRPARLLSRRAFTLSATAPRIRRCSAVAKQDHSSNAAPTSSSAAGRLGESAIDGLTQRLFAAAKPGDGKLLLLAAALVGIAALAAPGAALAEDQHNAQLLADIAEDTGFWANVARYISFYFSVLLGTAYVAVKPVVELFKRPTTALLALVAIGGLFTFVSFTVQAMLGVNDIFEYAP